MYSLLKRILLLLAVFLASWLLLVILVTSLGFDNNSPAASIAETVGAVFCVLVTAAVTELNRLQRLRADIPRLKADVGIVALMKEQLLAQAGMLVRQHLQHEEQTFAQVARERGGGDFLVLLERYPELTGDRSVMDMLRKIQDCELHLLRQRQKYTGAVAEYNSSICQFPANLLARTSGMRELPLEEDVLGMDKIRQQEE